MLIDFPIDVLFSPPQLHRIAFGAVDVPPAFAPAPDPAALEKLAGAWKAAKRPVIINGTGVKAIGPLLQKLAETTNTPVFYCEYHPRWIEAQNTDDGTNSQQTQLSHPT